MVDSTQTILFLVIIVLTVFLVVLGFQVFLILRDVRKTINKTNNLLDGVNAGSSIVKVASSILALVFGGKKLGEGLKGLISDVKEDPVKEVLKVISSKEIKEIIKKEEKPRRRFFRRNS